jgi:hypothetical protein
MAHPASYRFETAAAPMNTSDLQRYFEYSANGIDVLSDGLQEVCFGEFLIEHRILDRYQLFRALQLQDRQAGVRLGEAAAALGYVKIGEVEVLYARFAQLSTVMVG